MCDNKVISLSGTLRARNSAPRGLLHRDEQTQRQRWSESAMLIKRLYLHCCCVLPLTKPNARRQLRLLSFERLTSRDPDSDYYSDL